MTLKRAAAVLFLLAIACAGPRKEQKPPAAGEEENRGGPPPPDIRGPGRADAAPGVEEGLASWYGKQHHGRKTASGERFDMNGMTAAHRRHPFGTRIRVTDVETGNEVTVRVNDRGPYAKDRIVDLSKGAARRLGILERGVARVRVQPVVVADASK
jgi:rare lipoprotein A